MQTLGIYIAVIFLYIHTIQTQSLEFQGCRGRILDLLGSYHDQGADAGIEEDQENDGEFNLNALTNIQRAIYLDCIGEYNMKFDLKSYKGNNERLDDSIYFDFSVISIAESSENLNTTANTNHTEEKNSGIEGQINNNKQILEKTEKEMETDKTLEKDEKELPKDNKTVEASGTDKLDNKEIESSAPINQTITGLDENLKENKKVDKEAKEIKVVQDPVVAQSEPNQNKDETEQSGTPIATEFENDLGVREDLKEENEEEAKDDRAGDLNEVKEENNSETIIQEDSEKEVDVEIQEEIEDVGTQGQIENNLNEIEPLYNQEKESFLNIEVKDMEVAMVQEEEDEERNEEEEGTHNKGIGKEEAEETRATETSEEDTISGLPEGNFIEDDGNGIENENENQGNGSENIGSSNKESQHKNFRFSRNSETKTYNENKSPTAENTSESVNNMENLEDNKGLTTANELLGQPQSSSLTVNLATEGNDVEKDAEETGQTLVISQEQLDKEDIATSTENSHIEEENKTLDGGKDGSKGDENGMEKKKRKKYYFSYSKNKDYSSKHKTG